MKCEPLSLSIMTYSILSTAQKGPLPLERNGGHFRVVFMLMEIKVKQKKKPQNLLLSFSVLINLPFMGDTRSAVERNDKHRTMVVDAAGNNVEHKYPNVAPCIGRSSGI